MRDIKIFNLVNLTDSFLLRNKYKVLLKDQADLELEEVDLGFWNTFCMIPLESKS